MAVLQDGGVDEELLKLKFIHSKWIQVCQIMK